MTEINNMTSDMTPSEVAMSPELNKIEGMTELQAETGRILPKRKLVR